MKEWEHRIFSLPIWGVMLNDQVYQSKNYLDTILDLEKNQPSQKKSNFGGYQTHDKLHEIPIFKEFVEALENIGNKISINYTPEKLKIMEMWGNINYYKDSNAHHIHGGAISGVFYLETPENCGRLILNNPAVRSDGKLFKNLNYPIDPVKLACIFFPSWLEHYVEPNLSNQRRTSISFNLDIV